MTASVQTEVMEAGHLIKMTWGEVATADDMRTAFDDLIAALDRAPHFVLVDLSNNQQMNVSRTVFEAIRAYRHANLRRWLVVGANDIARTVGATLATLTARHNIMWFDTVDEAVRYADMHRF